MKVLLLVLISTSTLKVCAGRAADERQLAIAEINKKYDQVKATSTPILTAIQGEKSTTLKSTGETESMKHLDTKVNATKIEFEGDAKAVIRTAIVQSKSKNVIYCIRNVTFHGYDRFNELREVNRKNVIQVKEKKMQKIGFDDYAVNAIISGLRELMDQAVTRIKETSGVQMQTIKKEALGHCDSATLLLGEIEVCVHEPVLSREYVKARQEIDRSLGTTKKELNKSLDNCLTIKN